MRTAQLDGALDGVRAGGEQEDLLQRLGKNGDELFDQARADLAREAIVGEQARGSLRGDGVHDLLAAVAGVGDQHAGGLDDARYLVLEFHATGETNGDSHLKSLLVHHQVIVPVTKGKLEGALVK